MAKETQEELLVRRIEAGIRGLKNGTKSPNQVAEDGVERQLTRLKGINVGLYDDLQAKYNIAVHKYQPKDVKATRKATY